MKSAPLLPQDLSNCHYLIGSQLCSRYVRYATNWPQQRVYIHTCTWVLFGYNSILHVQRLAML
jgi:hypothetical protein